MADLERFHAHLESLISALPGPALAAGAELHGLDSALGYAHLQSLGGLGSIGGSFLRAHKSRLAIDLALQDGLQALARAFAACGVRAILLKGEAWSRSIYPIAGVRSRGDCDIWVPRADRDTAIAALENLGVTELRPYACAGEVLTPEATFRGLGLNVDLHWKLSTLSPVCRGLDFEDCWSRSIPVARLPSWRMLSPPDALLHAALHLACPGPLGPRWIAALDGRLLLDAAAMEPSALAQRAEQAGIGDLWRDFLDYVWCPGADQSSKHRPRRELYLLLTRAPWPDRARLLHELFWPREAFLRDRFNDPTAPLFQLQLRRWLASIKRIARRR